MKTIKNIDNDYFIVDSDGIICDNVQYLGHLYDYVRLDVSMKLDIYLGNDSYNNDVVKMRLPISVIGKSDSAVNTKGHHKIGFFNNQSMKLIGDCVFDEIVDVFNLDAESSEFRFEVRIGRMTGFINGNGDHIVSSNSKTHILSGEKYVFVESNCEHYCLSASHKWGKLYDNLDEAIPSVYDYIDRVNRTNMYKAVKESNPFFYYKFDDRFDLINYCDERLLFDDVEDYYDDFFLIRKTEYDSSIKVGLWKVEVILPCEYQNVSVENDNIILARKNDDKWIVFDYVNRRQIIDEYKQVSLADNLIFALKDNNKWLVYDYVAQRIIIDEMDDISNAYDENGDILNVLLCLANDIVHFIDIKGNILLRVKASCFDIVSAIKMNTFYDDRVIVELSDSQYKVGILDLSKSKMEKLDIYTKKDWESIEGGYYVPFSEKEAYINVTLNNGYVVKYNWNYEEVDRWKPTIENSENDGEQDYNSDDDYFFCPRDRYDDCSDPLDAFDGDEDAYNEWRNN